LLRFAKILTTPVAAQRLGPTILLLLLLAVGCGPSLPRAPTQPQDDSSFTAPAKVELPGVASDPPSPFVLQPGDLLHLRTVSVAPLDLSDLQVDAEGRIHVPLAGDIEVGGLSLGEAEKRTEQAIQLQDHFAHVILEVKSAAGHRAAVSGAVNRPGEYEIRPSTRIAEIMATAGGFKTFDADGESHDGADLEAARLIRDGVAMPVSIARAMQGEPRHNVRVRAGDILFVPPLRDRRITLLGDVRTPRLAPFHPGMRLTEALALGGGTTKDADNADVRIIRGSLSAPKVYRADLKALVAGRAGDVELAAGDIVFVTEHWFATATDVVNRLAPALALAAFTVSQLK
jgi:polysaccharide biosynthesis/export protein